MACTTKPEQAPSKPCRVCRGRPRASRQATCGPCRARDPKHRAAKSRQRSLRTETGRAQRDRQRARALRVSPSGRILDGSAYTCLSPAEWVALWQGQAGRCCVCNKGLCNRYDPASEGIQAALDHSHGVCAALLKAGADPREAVRRSIRGLLCSFPCNRALGYIRDCPNWARTAGEYLDSGPVNLDALAPTS